MTTAEAPSADEDLVTALGELTNPPKEGKVSAGQRQYKFMTLPDLLGAVRPVFAAHRLAVMQDVETRERGVSVVTRIVHASGRVFESPALVLACNQDPQSVGSAISYARRYQLSAMVGLTGDDDDDGQAATVHTSARNSKETQAAEYAQTRPVARAPKRADDPGDAPYQTPLTPTQVRAPDATSPTARRTATPAQTKLLWTMLSKTEWSEEQVRDWVKQTLDLPTADWHTADLLGWQVSALIDRLKPPVFDPGPDRPRAGQ